MRAIRNLVWLPALAAAACSSGGSIPPGGSGGSAAGGTSGNGAGLAGASTGASAGAPASGGTGGATMTAGSGGAIAGSGGSAVAGAGGSGGAAPGTGGTPTFGGAATGPLIDRIVTRDITLPAGVKAGVGNWRIWARQNLRVAPVFVVPRANCGTLVCLTTGTAMAPNARLARLDASDQLIDVLDLGAGYECRGLAAEPDGHFAALLWRDSDDTILVRRYDAEGKAGFSTGLTNADNNPTAFDIGESRLEFGAGKYGAYYHVHSDSGHEGDTLKWVAAATGAETTGWAWGCSHSMSNLLTFNATSSTFLPACVTDCYPGTSGSNFATASIGGIYLNHDESKVMDVAAGCNGSVAGELGGAAAAPSGWKMVFNAHQAPTTRGQESYDKSTMNQDIGWTSVAGDMTPSAVTWLTSTSSIHEADSAIARWQPSGDAAEQYVVGWSEPGTASVYKLARLSGAGAVLEEPVDVTAKAKWGQRDDPFRQHYNQDVVWAWFDAANSTTLRFARLRSGGSAQCAAF